MASAPEILPLIILPKRFESMDDAQVVCEHKTALKRYHSSVCTNRSSVDSEESHGDNSSLCTLSTKDSTDFEESHHIDLSFDSQDDTEDSRTEGEVVTEKRQAAEASALRALSLHEAMETGDVSYFTEGFVAVGDLPCIY